MDQGISKLSLDKGNKLKEGHGGLPRERIFLCWWKEKGRERMCEEKISSYVWKRGVHGKGCARIKHGRRLCVANTCSKASRFLVQLIVLPKSTIGFVSNLN